MFTYQRDAAHVAKLANQYNFDQVVECLADGLDPKVAAQHLKLLYFTLSEYVMRDTECPCPNYDVVDAMATLRWLHEAIETMTNGEKTDLSVVPSAAKCE